MNNFKQVEPSVVWWSTAQEAVDIMLEMAHIKRGDLLYDLGCGDGRIVITAAKRYGIRAIGFDVRSERVHDCRQKVKENGVDHLVSIQYKDMFTVDLTPASVITMYLLPNLNLRLIPQLKQCKPGTRVMSYDFDMGHIKPEQTRYVNGHTVYGWTIPFKKDNNAEMDNAKKSRIIRTHHDQVMRRLMF